MTNSNQATYRDLALDMPISATDLKRVHRTWQKLIRNYFKQPDPVKFVNDNSDALYQLDETKNYVRISGWATKSGNPELISWNLSNIPLARYSVLVLADLKSFLKRDIDFILDLRRQVYATNTRGLGPQFAIEEARIMAGGMLAFFESYADSRNWGNYYPGERFGRLGDGWEQVNMRPAALAIKLQTESVSSWIHRKIAFMHASDVCTGFALRGYYNAYYKSHGKPPTNITKAYLELQKRKDALKNIKDPLIRLDR